MLDMPENMIDRINYLQRLKFDYESLRIDTIDMVERQRLKNAEFYLQREIDRYMALLPEHLQHNYWH